MSDMQWSLHTSHEVSSTWWSLRIVGWCVSHVCLMRVVLESEGSSVYDCSAPSLPEMKKTEMREESEGSVTSAQTSTELQCALPFWILLFLCSPWPCFRTSKIWSLLNMSHTQVLIFSHLVWEFRVTLCEFKQNYHYSSFRAIHHVVPEKGKAPKATWKVNFLGVRKSWL